MAKYPNHIKIHSNVKVVTSLPSMVSLNNLEQQYDSVQQAKEATHGLFHDETMRLSYAHALRKTVKRSDVITVPVYDLGGKIVREEEVSGPIAKLALDLRSQGVVNPLIDAEILVKDPEDIGGWYTLSLRVKEHLEKQYPGYRLIPINPSSDGRGAVIDKVNTYVLGFRLIKGADVSYNTSAKYWAYSMFYLQRGDESHGRNLGTHNVAIIKGNPSDDGNAWARQSSFIWVTRLEKLFGYAEPKSYAKKCLMDPVHAPASFNVAMRYIPDAMFNNMCRANGVDPEGIDVICPEKSVKFWDGTPIIAAEFHTMQLGASRTRATISASHERMRYAMTPFGDAWYKDLLATRIWMVEDAINQTIIGNWEPIKSVMRLVLETAKDTEDEEFDKGIDSLSLFNRRIMAGLPISASELLQIKTQLYLYNVKRTRVKGITAPIFNEDSLGDHEISINYRTALSLKINAEDKGIAWRMPCMFKEMATVTVKKIHFLEGMLINGVYAAKQYNADFDWDKMSFVKSEEDIVDNSKIKYFAAKGHESVNHNMFMALACSKMGKTMIGIYNSAIDAVRLQTNNLEIVNEFADNTQAIVDSLKKAAVFVHPKVLAAKYELMLSLSATQKALLGRIDESKFEPQFSSKKVTPMKFMMTQLEAVVDRNLNRDFEEAMVTKMCIQVPFKNSTYVQMRNSDNEAAFKFAANWDRILIASGYEDAIPTGERDNRLWDDNHFPMDVVESNYDYLFGKYCALIKNKESVSLAREMANAYDQWFMACRDSKELDPYKYLRDMRLKVRELNVTNPETVGYALQYLFTVVTLRSHYKLVKELDKAEPNIKTRSTALAAAYMLKAGVVDTESHFDLANEVKQLNYTCKTQMRAFKVKDFVTNL